MTTAAVLMPLRASDKESPPPPYVAHVPESADTFTYLPTNTYQKAALWEMPHMLWARETEDSAFMKLNLAWGLQMHCQHLQVYIV